MFSVQVVKYPEKCSLNKFSVQSVVIVQIVI